MDKRVSSTKPDSGTSAEFVKKSELAVLLGVTPRTITEWYRMGLPVCRVSARMNLHHFPSCRAWVLKKQVSVVVPGGAR